MNQPANTVSAASEHAVSVAHKKTYLSPILIKLEAQETKGGKINHAFEHFSASTSFGS